MVFNIAIISFILGVIISGLVVHLLHSRKELETKEELIKLRAKLETSEDLQEIIKRDFVQLANETIKNEQEDLRKQNRETLEEKILPLTKELGEFKEKVEHFNLKGVENTTKIVEQITNLEKNNKIIEQENSGFIRNLEKSTTSTGKESGGKQSDRLNVKTTKNESATRHSEDRERDEER